MSTEDPTPLAAAFEAAGCYANVTCDRDGLWYGLIEAEDPEEPGDGTPEFHIAGMLVVLDSLDGPAQVLWSGCTLREFNIGYDCGDEPWAFNQGLSSELLNRIAAAGASLRFTLYPER